MKKLVAILLSVCVLFAVFAIASSAAVIEENNGTDTGDVTVKVVDTKPGETNVETVYYVDVTWESLEFTFVWEATDGSNVAWNPETHTYQGENGEDAVGAWEADTKTDAVTVTNHSDANIDVTAAFTNGTKTSDAANGVTAALSDDDGSLTSAAEVAYGVFADAESLTYDVSVSGQPGIVTTFKVDTITVTISNPAAPVSDTPDEP